MKVMVETEQTFTRLRRIMKHEGELHSSRRVTLRLKLVGDGYGMSILSSLCKILFGVAQETQRHLISQAIYIERKIWLRMCRGLINQTPTGLRNNLIRSV